VYLVSVLGLVSINVSWQVEDDAGRRLVLFAHGDSTFWAATVDAVRSLYDFEVLSTRLPEKICIPTFSVKLTNEAP
jgi:hypothetical protein